MGEPDEVEEKIRRYQAGLEKYSERQDHKTLKSLLQKLEALNVQIVHLERTGVGRSVNALRKWEGSVGEMAKDLVWKWKSVVVGETRDAEDEEERKIMKAINQNISESDINQNRTGTLPSSSTGSHRSEEESNNTKHSSHSKSSGSSSSRNESQKHKSSRHKEAETKTKEKHRSSSSGRKDNKDKEKEKEREKAQSSQHRKRSVEASESDGEEVPTKRSKHVLTSSSDDAYDDDVDDDDDVPPPKPSTSKSKKYVVSSDSENEVPKANEKKKHKSSHSSSSSHKHRPSSSKIRDDSSAEPEVATKTKSDSSSKSSSSKTEKSKSDSSKERDKSRHKDSGKRESTASSSSKPKDHHDSSSKDRKHEKKSSSSSRKTEEKTKGSDSSEGKKKAKSSSSGTSAKSAMHSSIPLNGIDSGSGASFAEALGMLEPPAASRSSPAKKKVSQQQQAEKSSKEKSGKEKDRERDGRDRGESSSSSSRVDSSLPKLLKEPTTEPVDLNISSLLPAITPNYRPLNSIVNVESNAKKAMTEYEALSSIISSKNQRTKVYSGNKSAHGKVPSLFDMCIMILQDNIESLEYTGGVPYSILKPILDKATPNQLFTLEHYNPYLIEDTDELWKMHCQKDFRNKRQEELETWREMYIRCLEEREAKLKALTANIKQAQDKSVPVRQTILAYVNDVAKPPRNIARKQLKNGTGKFVEKKPAVTPQARLNSLATAGEAGKVAVPNPGGRAAERSSSSSSSKPQKKAPLMLKSLSLLKNRFKR